MKCKIYGEKDTADVEVGTYGWFGDTEGAVKNAQATSQMMRLADVYHEDKIPYKYKRADGKCYALFLPVCRHCNLKAYNAYRKGKVVQGAERSYVMPYADEVDRVEYPDFLNDTLTVKEEK